MHIHKSIVAGHLSGLINAIINVLFVLCIDANSDFSYFWLDKLFSWCRLWLGIAVSWRPRFTEVPLAVPLSTLCTSCFKKISDTLFIFWITQSKVNQLQKFLEFRIVKKVCIRRSKTRPSHRLNVATVPWEIRQNNRSDIIVKKFYMVVHVWLYGMVRNFK